MGDVLLVLFVHSVFLPENSRKKHKLHTRQTMLLTVCCLYPPQHTHTHMLLSFTFLYTNPASKVAAGESCLPRAAVCTKLSAQVDLKVSFWYPGRMGAASGPHLPFSWGDTEGNQSFFWGVAGCLLQSGSLLRAWHSSVPLVASECWCKVCRPVHPGSGMRAELGRGGKWILSGAVPL